MKKLIITGLFTFAVILNGVGAFAQGNGSNQQVQAQNVNYYDNINDDNNPVQTNLNNQQANPPAQQQSTGNNFGSEGNENTNGKVYCKDCEAVKKALAAARASSGSSHHKRSLGMKHWSKTFAGRMDMKMKKVFAHRKKVRTSYEVCFNWH